MSLTTTQNSRLAFLARTDADYAQIEVRTARKLLRLNLIESRPGSDPEADAKAGGWTFVRITDAGREVVA